MASHYRISPQGISRHCWINKPDTKFVAEGLYHTDLGVSDAEAQKFMEEIKQASDEGYEQMMKEKDLTAAKQKSQGWSTYYPYDIEYEDAEGKEDVPTGTVWFKFKQNAKIRQPDGAMKPFVLGIRDSKDKATKANVFSGSIIRVKYKPRAVIMTSAKQAGVRLDFSMVQLIAMAESRGGFGEVDDGFVDEGGGGKSPPADDTDY